jgi:hypothetical protein
MRHAHASGSRQPQHLARRLANDIDASEKHVTQPRGEGRALLGRGHQLLSVEGVTPASLEDPADANWRGSRAQKRREQFGQFTAPESRQVDPQGLRPSLELCQ